MKRSPELSPLSHDHHQALFVAQKLRRADDREASTAELLEYWEPQGRRHFEVEEGVLLPAWFELDPDPDPSLAARVAAEHLAIRTLVRRARAGDLELGGVHEAGRLLADHVRFEEREFFPLVERRLAPAALRQLGEEIAAAEKS